MTTRLKVLVTGATGKQGGATARLLVKHGHYVRALTRNAASPAAQALAATGVELVPGDLQDRDSVDRAVAGMDAMFLVTAPFGGVDAETRQGIAAADSAKAAGTYLVMGPDGVKMYEWFETTGYTADRTALRRDFPEVPWFSFEAWARAQNWKALLDE